MTKRARNITVNDKMQRGYTYTLTAAAGRDFDPEFRPELTPKEMLALRRLRRKVHDRLPQRISRELVCARETFAVRFQSSA
jgi:hypothetical protein